MNQGNRDCILKLVARDLADIDLVPASERIDLHQAAAVVLFDFDKTASDLAAHTAGLLREAERHQLKFRDLLKPGGTQ